MKKITRRLALENLVQLYGAANILGAQQTRRPAAGSPALDDPLYEPVNVMDFAAIAQKKLDPVAWDYLDHDESGEE